MRLDNLLGNTESRDNILNMGIEVPVVSPQTRNTDIEMIRYITRAISSSLVLSDVLTLVVDYAIEIGRGDRGFIMLRNSESKLEFALARNARGQTLSGDDFEISQSTVSDVYEIGEPVCLENALGDNNFNARQSISKLQLRTVICFPLTMNEDVIGVLYVDSDKLQRWDREEVMNMFEIMSGQVAIAIRNAQIYHQLKTENEELKKALAECTQSAKAK
jgi:GAF domain-containing protein